MPQQPSFMTKILLHCLAVNVFFFLLPRNLTAYNEHKIRLHLNQSHLIRTFQPDSNYKFNFLIYGTIKSIVATQVQRNLERITNSCSHYYSCVAILLYVINGVILTINVFTELVSLQTLKTKKRLLNGDILISRDKNL